MSITDTSTKAKQGQPLEFFTMENNTNVRFSSLTELESFRNQQHCWTTDKFLSNLENIVTNLNEDDDDCQFRCAIGKLDTANKDLIPILISNKVHPIVRSTTIKLLAALTMPIKDLVKKFKEDSENKFELVCDVSKILYSVKEAFLDPMTPRAILDYLRDLSQKETFLNNDYESVMHSMSLMRNILLVPEPFDVVDEDSVVATVATVQPCNSMLNLDPRHRYLVYESQHNRILWNLFAMGLDDLLIKLYTVCPENEKWIWTTFEVIKLFYKDQEVMQKLLNLIDKSSSLSLPIIGVLSSTSDLNSTYRTPTGELPEMLLEFTCKFLRYINFSYRLMTKEVKLAGYLLFDYRQAPTIELLRNQLINSGFQDQLIWIKESLLTFISIKLGNYNGKECRHPIECLSNKMNMPCPIFPRTEAETSTLRCEPFLLLLQKVGLIPAGSDKYFSYPRIPTEWSVDTMIRFATFFGST